MVKKRLRPLLPVALHCACGGKADCKLRLITLQRLVSKRPRYEVSSMLPVKEKIHVKGRMMV